MKNKLTRLAALFLVVATMIPTLLMPVSAATTPRPSTNFYISCYTKPSSGKVYAYTNANLNQRTGGYIACSTDECRIVGLSGNAVQVSYPVSGGRRTAWFAVSSFTDFSLNGGNCQSVKATGKMTTYRRSTGSATYGSVSKNDLVYILDTENNRTQLIYPVGSRYKMAWVSASDANKYLKTTTASTSSSSSSSASSSSSTVADGRNTISSYLNSKLVLDISNNSSSSMANVQIYESNGTTAQQFDVTHVGGGWYKIVHAGTNKALDVAGGVRAPMVNVWQYTYSANNDAQLWRFIKTQWGWYIQSKLGYYLDVQGGIAQSGTNVWVYSGNPNTLNRAQVWSLNKVSSGSSSSSNSGTLNWNVIMPNVNPVNPNATNTTKVSMTSVLYQLPASTANKLTCGFDGYSSMSGRHEGIDFAYGSGKAVHSLTDGVVTRVTEGDSNNLSTIAIYQKSTDKTIIYLHTNPLDELEVGDTVERGQQIATECNRPSKYKTHTHVEMREGYHTAATYSSNNVLENPDPTAYWESQGYSVK